MLRKFEDMNLQMEKTGSFKPATAKEALLQMVARNNLLLSDIILKLGISERFDAAWKDADCNKVARGEGFDCGCMHGSLHGAASGLEATVLQQLEHT